MKCEYFDFTVNQVSVGATPTAGAYVMMTFVTPEDVVDRIRRASYRVRDYGIPIDATYELRGNEGEWGELIVHGYVSLKWRIYLKKRSLLENIIKSAITNYDSICMNDMLHDANLINGEF